MVRVAFWNNQRECYIVKVAFLEGHWKCLMVEVALLNNESISVQTLDGYGRRALGSKVLLERAGSKGENSKCWGWGCFLALGHRTVKMLHHQGCFFKRSEKMLHHQGCFFKRSEKMLHCWGCFLGGTVKMLHCWGCFLERTVKMLHCRGCFLALGHLALGSEC